MNRSLVRAMRAPKTSLFAILLPLLIVSCAEQPEPASEPAEPDEIAVATFVVTTSQTDAVAAWNERYEANADARAAAGMSEVLTAEDLDRPGTVVTIQSVADAGAVLEFLESGRSTVDASDVSVFSMVELGSMPERPVAIVIVHGRVDDIDRWNADRVAGSMARAEAGLFPAGVGVEAGGTAGDGSGGESGEQPAVFQAYFATDLDAARQWVAGEPAEASLSPMGRTPVVRLVEPIN
ncbi:MAG: hypothetical protein HKN17_06430 [Rhodothermales bacterium]|nr:hypothetical protein [Rhodothermales bacterium]